MTQLRRKFTSQDLFLGLRRRWFVLGSFVLFFAALWFLKADPRDLVPSPGGQKIALEFFRSAFQPALTFESETMQEGGTSFFGHVLSGLWLTVRYAIAAMTLAIPIGIIGGILGARSWWQSPSRSLEVLRRGARLFATAMRSVHELMWALLLISAIGTSPIAAVLALAIPYGGTLAKVFSELLDETHSSAAEVMRATGGSGFAAFWGAVVPSALPDLMTYTMYRLECAVRSSAVLGFVGIPTLGFQISSAFEDGHFRQIWSYLYALLIVVLLFEWLGSRMRGALAKGCPARAEAMAGDDVVALKRKRGRSLFVRLTGGSLLVLGMVSWLIGQDWFSGVSAARRWENLQRFGGELIPFPMRGDGGLETIGPWLQDLLIWEGLDAVWRTFQLGTAAALLAGALALVGIALSARSLATRTPRGIPMAEGLWRKPLGKAFRILAVGGRAMPEFILAFLLLQIFGPTIWALIFALAIHNGGILLRLGAEVVDNLESHAAQLVLLEGANRSTTYFGILLPESFNRFVLYLFYRWETCIREATILGMLGVGSLGFLISEAGVRFYYDEMLLWVVLGGGLVFIGDLASDYVRYRLKDS